VEREALARQEAEDAERERQQAAAMVAGFQPDNRVEETKVVEPAIIPKKQEDDGDLLFDLTAD